jgi:hypothetical protein
MYTCTYKGISTHINWIEVFLGIPSYNVPYVLDETDRKVLNDDALV